MFMQGAWQASQINIRPDSSASSLLLHRQVVFQCTQKEAAYSRQPAAGIRSISPCRTAYFHWQVPVL